MVRNNSATHPIGYLDLAPTAFKSTPTYYPILNKYMPDYIAVTNFVLNSTAALSPTTAQQTVTSLTTQPSEAKDPILSTIFYVVLAIGVCLLVMKCLQWIWNSFSTWCLERRVDSS